MTMKILYFAPSALILNLIHVILNMQVVYLCVFCRIWLRGEAKRGPETKGQGREGMKSELEGAAGDNV